MKVVIDNAVCSNGGDMAIALSVKKLIYQTFGSDADIAIFDSRPEDCQKLYPNEKFYPLLSEVLFQYSPDWGRRKKLTFFFKSLWTWIGLWLIKCKIPLGKNLFSKSTYEALTTYRNADLVISTGGTYLVENYGLYYRFVEFSICKFFRKKLCLYTQSMGPFTEQYNIKNMRKYLKYAQLVFLRDQRSLNNIAYLVDDKSKCHVLADSVFALFQPEYIEKYGDFSKKSSIKKVAISVRDWSYFENSSPEDGMDNYKSAIVDLVHWLVRTHKTEITFVSTCQGLESYQYDDSSVAMDIYRNLAEDVHGYVKVNQDFHSPQELIEICQSMDLVYATRMHMMILSLCAGTPVIPIAYEFKQIELSKRLNIENLLLDINTITFDHAKNVTELYLDQSNDLNKHIFDYVQHEYISALSAEKLLKSI